MNRGVNQDAGGHGFSVIRGICDYRLRTVFRDAPGVPHYGEPGTGPLLQGGMFLTIDPTINPGGPAAKIDPDGCAGFTGPPRGR